MLLARHFVYDRNTRELQLLGLFSFRRILGRPSPPQAFTAYAELVSGPAEGTIELVVTHMETERDVYRYQRWIALLPHTAVHPVYVTPRRCVFPDSGRYNVVMRFDGRELASHPLDIRLEEPSHG
jgi:hypothetical protein